MKKFFSKMNIRRHFTALLASLFCAGAIFTYAEPLFANGVTPAGESKGSDSTKTAEKTKKTVSKTKKTVKKPPVAKKTAAKKTAVKKAQAKEVAIIDTASQDIPLHQGRALVEEGRYRSAIAVLKNYLKANQKSASGWYWIARAHHALGDYDRAQLAVNIALQIDPYYPALTKTPSGLEPMPKNDRRARVEPYPSRSVLPVKQPLPSKLPLEPITISFPLLTASGDSTVSGDRIASASRDVYLKHVPYPPLPAGETKAWMQAERFMEISRWRSRVDRMAILESPRVPIAWKGSHPYEVYFWTGDEWARVRRNPEKFDYVERYDDILYRTKDDIEKILRERNFYWFERDTPAFAAVASTMRYTWFGDIKLDEAAKRAFDRKWIERIVAPARNTDQQINEK